VDELLSPVLEYVWRQSAEAGPEWSRAAGARIDLHCHSTYSREAVRWLPGLVCRPVCEPEQVYDLAKARGMDFVTITDHDTLDGCLALIERRGPLPDFIFGEEVSARFPEDGTVVHVNVYDHELEQHRQIQSLRGNIHELVAYLRQIGKLYVLNHMTWTAQHRVLAGWQIDTLLELFDVFEGLNGTRGYGHNAWVCQVAREHGKVLVAGSDSHTHRVGTTYTLTAGTTRSALLANLRAGRAACCGAFGTPEKLREDVWAVFHRSIERRLTEESSRWHRLLCRAAERIGQALYPLACLGYHKYQDVLIRGFVRALPV